MLTNSNNLTEIFHVNYSHRVIIIIPHQFATKIHFGDSVYTDIVILQPAWWLLIVLGAVHIFDNHKRREGGVSDLDYG